MKPTATTYAPCGDGAAEWEDLFAAVERPNLLQSRAYGEAKAASGPWRVERGILAAEGRPAGLVQTLVRALPIGLGGLAWINRGPLPLGDGAQDTDLLADMIVATRRHFADARGFYLRLAPAIEAARFDAAAAARSGMTPTDTFGWASAILDLSPSEDQLRQALGGKWRGHLNKGARLIADVQSGTSPELFEAFLAGHEALLAPGDFSTSVNTAFLRAYHARTAEAEKPEIFLARHDGAVVGSVLIAKFGSGCEYLATNATAEGRRLNVGQLLLWRAICAMKERGYRFMDLSGMDPVHTPKGIYQFKEGVGASRYRFADELECGRGLANRLVRWRVSRARRGP